MKIILFLAAFVFEAAAHAFPTKPVRSIVAFPPGGGTDIVARLLAQRLGETWGQAVIVENRAGASGTVGTEAAARADPDGHTLFMATMGNMTANQHLYPKMAVDPLRAFAPITDYQGRRRALRASRQSRTSGKGRAGVDRAGEATPWRNRLQLLRARRRAAPRDGALQAPRRRRPAARALQGQRPKLQRPHRRARHADRGQTGAVAAAPQRPPGG